MDTSTIQEDLRSYRLFIDGEWVDGASGEVRKSINPTTGRPWATFAEATSADVDKAVGAARRAFDEGPWGKMTGRERALRMRRLGEVIQSHADDLSRVETRDNGKLLREMAGQVACLRGTTTTQGWPTRSKGRRSRPRRRTSSPTRCVNRWEWSVRSCRGTRRSC